MSDIERWRGLKNLLRDTIEQGASAIERVHLATANRPFTVLAQLPALDAPVRGIQQIHDLCVATTYASVRGVTRMVGVAADMALDAVEAAANAPTDERRP